MTELEILRRRRELVILSAELQRATVVRRFDRVSRHPVHAVLGLATSAASVPIVVKIASMVFDRARRKRAPARAAAKKPRWAISRVLPALGLLPVLKIFPVLKSFNR